MNDFWMTARNMSWNLTHRLGFTDVLDILIVVAILYEVMILMRRTRSSALLKATVLPNETNDKAVVWTSSDEKVAKVISNGLVTGVARGDCEIVCTSKNDANIWAKATVHVQQPVKKISFGDAPAVYAGETGTLTWKVEPA